VRPSFPWVAVLGQERLKLALLLCAIDPGIGGVLVRGPRGVAKTTLARGFADLLPGRFVELPLGATEERVAGSLDLGKALGEGQVRFSPGLLALAHEGVLYVDEVNLLPDALVDLLLDAAASGSNVVERDGVSHAHAARFVLVGTMNPDEGELRPQLLDRFGLCASALPLASAEERAQVVLRRLAFERDPGRFVADFADEQQALRERCERARARASALDFAGPAVARAAALCQAAAVEGVRADLAMLRAARAHAAWHERDAITASDVDAVAELALAHRRRAAGSPPGSSGAGRPGVGSASETGSTGGASPAAGAASPRTEPASGRTEPASGRTEPAAPTGASGPRAQAPDAPFGSARASSAATGQGLAPVPVRAAEPPLLPAWLARPVPLPRRQTRPGAPRQRRARGGIAHPVGAIDWVGTLSRTPRPAHADLRRRQRRLAAAGTSVIALDCSASMLESGALRHAKGLVRALAARATRDRAPLALVSFGGRDARVELAAPRAGAAIDATVSSLLAGGGTPLRRALELSIQLCQAAPPAPSAPRLFVFTDGRARDAVEDLALACRGFELVVIDCERGRVRLGRARRIALALAGRLAHIDALAHVEWPAH
jgi:magnesium chelatase subunit D